ncbi:MAG: protease modulator HflK [Ruminococcaceae bacterium]|nr:protease modulator HflK [Oscillospiraceae bacterium]
MKKKQTLLGDVLETVTKYFLIAVAVVVLLILLSGIRIVNSGNSAVVLRFGKLVGDNREEQVHEPGLLFAFPYFIDEVITVPTGKVIEQSVTTHYTADGTSLKGIQGGYLITGDQNIVVVSASVKYIIADPVEYALHVKNMTSLIDTAVSNAMVSESAKMEVDSLLTDGKDDFAVVVMKRATEKLVKMGTGVTITAVELTQVAAPEEVRDSFQAVNAASVYAETVVQRAKTYENTRIPEAQAKANATEAEATKQKNAAIGAADRKLAEFTGVAKELASRRAAIYTSHGHDPELVSGCDECDEAYAAIEQAVKARIYTDKYMAVMSKIDIQLIDDDGNKVYIKGQ